MSEVLDDYWSSLGAFVPLRKNSKRPTNEDYHGYGAKSRLTLPQARSHVSSGKNLGLMIGKGYVVIDVDVHNSPDPEVAVLAIEQFFERYRLPDTGLHSSARHDTSPRSGHYWFRLPTEHKAKSTVLVHKLQGLSNVDILTWPSYVVIPPSIHEDLGVPYTASGEAIPDLPANLYKTLRRKPAEMLKLTQKHLTALSKPHRKVLLEKARSQARYAILDFRLQREGNRDNRHAPACFAVGTLAALGAKDKEIQQWIKRITSAGRHNGADASTLGKTMRHIQRGVERPRIWSKVDIEDEWWFTRPSLEATYWSAMSNGVSPWAMLMSQLVMLAVGTDHRVRLRPWEGDHAPAPIALWLTLVGDPGRGKSSAIELAKHWASEMLPLLPAPPRPELLVPTSPDFSWHDDRTHTAERQPMSSYIARQPHTNNGVFALYEGRVKVASDKSVMRPRRVVLGEKRGDTAVAKVGYRRLAVYGEPDALFGRTAKEYVIHDILRDSFYSAGRDNMIGKLDSRYTLAPRSYSLSLIMGVQLGRAKSIEKELGESTGWLDRMLYADAHADIELKRQLAGTIKPGLTRGPEIVSWDPVELGVKGAGYLYRHGGLVSMDSAATSELRDFKDWMAAGCPPTLCGISAAQIDGWKTITGGVQSGHRDVVLARLAAMLARLDGVPMVDGRVEIDYSYLQDAKILHRHSAVLRDNIKHVSNTQYREKRDIYLAEATEEEEARAQGRKRAKRAKPGLTDAEWLRQRLAALGGSAAPRTLTNAGRKRGLGTSQSIYDLVSAMPDVTYDKETKKVVGL